MKDKILQIHNRYLEIYPELSEEESIIYVLEGLGAYSGRARKECIYKHPKGRMGATIALISKNELLFYSNHASSLPDDPQGAGFFNSNKPDPTPCLGIYPLYSHLHNNKLPAFELARDNQTIPVIRSNFKSTSSFINIHHRTKNDSKEFAWSTGCITVLKKDFVKILKLTKVTIKGKYQGSDIYKGKIIIDRSHINNNLQTLYRNLYGNFYKEVFNVNNILDLKEKAIKDIELINNRLVTDVSKVKEEEFTARLMEIEKTKKVEKKEYLVVTTNKLNVRTGVGVRNRKVGKIERGDKIENLGKERGWYNIRLGTLVGWVSGRHVKKF